MFLAQNSKMHARGHRAGIFHHVGQQLAEQRGVHQVDFFVAVAHFDRLLAVAAGEAVQRVRQQADRQIHDVA